MIIAFMIKQELINQFKSKKNKQLVLNMKTHNIQSFLNSSTQSLNEQQFKSNQLKYNQLYKQFSQQRIQLNNIKSHLNLLNIEFQNNLQQNVQIKNIVEQKDKAIQILNVKLEQAQYQINKLQQNNKEIQTKLIELQQNKTKICINQKCKKAKQENIGLLQLIQYYQYQVAIMQENIAQFQNRLNCTKQYVNSKYIQDLQEKHTKQIQKVKCCYLKQIQDKMCQWSSKYQIKLKKIFFILTSIHSKDINTILIQLINQFTSNNLSKDFQMGILQQQLEDACAKYISKQKQMQKIVQKYYFLQKSKNLSADEHFLLKREYLTLERQHKQIIDDSAKLIDSNGLLNFRISRNLNKQVLAQKIIPLNQSKQSKLTYKNELVSKEQQLKRANSTLKLKLMTKDNVLNQKQLKKSVSSSNIAFKNTLKQSIKQLKRNSVLQKFRSTESFDSNKQNQLNLINN